MKSTTVISFIALIALIVSSVTAQNRLFSLEYTGDNCQGSVSSASVVANYGNCVRLTGGTTGSTRTVCDGNTQTTFTYSSTDCTGTATNTQTADLDCNYSCSANIPISGTYAVVENYEDCANQVLSSTQYVSTSVCLPVSSTTSLKYGCNDDDELVSREYATNNRCDGSDDGVNLVYRTSCNGNRRVTACSGSMQNAVLSMSALIVAVIVMMVGIF